MNVLNDLRMKYRGRLVVLDVVYKKKIKWEKTTAGLCSNNSVYISSLLLITSSSVCVYSPIRYSLCPASGWRWLSDGQIAQCKQATDNSLIHFHVPPCRSVYMPSRSNSSYILPWEVYGQTTAEPGELLFRRLNVPGSKKGTSYVCKRLPQRLIASERQ